MRWLIQRGLDLVTIFLRDSSGDHIQQAKYRGRLHVGHEVSGDVSLQLNTLEMDDRSHYTCEVTWQTPDGNQVMKDKIIELRVQKLSVSKPTVTTGSGYGFTVPQGMRISLQCQAWGSPPISYVWYKEQTNNQEPTQVAVFSTLFFKPAMVTDSGSYFCTAKGRVGSEQRSDTVKFVVKATFTVTTFWDWTTEVDDYSGESSAEKGKGLPIFAIILIISLCCMVVFTMAYIMFFRKTSQQGKMHAREARNAGEAMRVAIFTSGCSSNEPASEALDNNYSNEPSLGQEYQIIAQINSDYAYLLHTLPPDYDLLATEGKSVCQNMPH
ncbi:V-set and immunoglobulin domain-containing protein 4 [Tupaia chinensis]|nr:V-set and immunoglobulin domain-containing protein 4 [Tupaia chinensis]